MTPNNLPVREDDLRAWSLMTGLSRIPLVICALAAIVAISSHPGGHVDGGGLPHSATAFSHVVEGLVIALAAWGSR